jgi:hypothetical protein
MEPAEFVVFADQCALRDRRDDPEKSTGRVTVDLG